jgi:outer membrane protein assembly factor BamD (BamD/ComL family)
MKNKTAFFRIFAPCALGLALLAGCSSGPPVIPYDLSVLQFFQKAQEEMDYDEWENALIYYRTFIERHPEDLPNVTAARYEIAYINYKQENYAEAAKGFRELLDFYDTTELPLSFPLWPRVLARRVMQTMRDKDVLPEEAPSATEAG